MALIAEHWRGNRRLQEASEHPPFLTRGEERKGAENRAAVVLLQEALILAGFEIAAGATGNYGDQTARAVQLLQRDPRFNLRPDVGIAGREVLGALDQWLQQNAS